jgi:hypothetical protein
MINGTGRRYTAKKRGARITRKRVSRSASFMILLYIIVDNMVKSLYNRGNRVFLGRVLLKTKGFVTGYK